MSHPPSGPATAPIIHRKGKIIGPRDLTIHCQAWVPENPPRAVVLLVHGLKEHSGRYMSLVQHLVPRGFAVYGFDLPGHGQSQGTRTYIERFEDYIITLERYRTQVAEWQPQVTVFLYGHSMGALVSIQHLIQGQQLYRGAVISAPLFHVPEDQPGWMIAVGMILSRLAPKIRLLGVNDEGLSRVPRVIQEYRQDPLVFQGKTTARLAAELYAAIQRARSQAGKISLPVLILQGEDDPIVDPRGAQELYETLTSGDKTLKRYPGCYHELHHEREEDRLQVLQDLSGWLEDRLTSRS